MSERQNLRVLKKLAPDQPGARKLALKFGQSLICVRHRTDSQGQFRYTTVELLVDKTAIQPRTDKIVRIRINYNEGELRTVVRAAGGRWDPSSKAWLISRRVAGALRLLDRIATK